MPPLAPTLRFTRRLFASAYVLAVAALAILGFTTASTATILVAAALTLPASVIAMPAYYLAFGLLAQVPGANPTHSTGSIACEPTGGCQGVTTGNPESWFIHGTEALGILALAAAAVLNVMLLERLITARGHRADTGA